MVRPRMTRTATVDSFIPSRRAISRQARPGGRKRLDWRLAAIVAAMLLLSACAYAVARSYCARFASISARRKSMSNCVIRI